MSALRSDSISSPCTRTPAGVSAYLWDSHTCNLIGRVPRLTTCRALQSFAVLVANTSWNECEDSLQERQIHELGKWILKQRKRV